MKRMTPAFSAVSTAPRAMAATGSDTRCSGFLRGEERSQAAQAQGRAEQGAGRLPVVHPAGV